MASSQFKVHEDIVSEIVNVSGTTAANGGINVTTNYNYTTGSIYAMSNISDDNTKNYRITVAGKPYPNAVTLRYRNTVDNSALANTSVSDKVLIIGKI